MKEPILAILALTIALPAFAGEAARPDKAKESAAELEKENAMAQPYPSDFGPDALDEAVLKTYPAARQAGYKVLKAKCTACHTASRPLNSRFVEPECKTQAACDAAVKRLAATHKGEGIWQIEHRIWNRYVKRRMADPGCDLTPLETMKIWEFLVYDGRRKVGEGAEAWKAHRQKLMDKLKADNPARFKELQEQNDL